MAVVDELITKYTLDDKGYKSGAQRVMAATQRVGQGLQHVYGIARGALVPLSAMAAGAAFIGYRAMQAAAQFDTFERTIGGAMGSLELGKQAMAAIADYAQKSAFDLAMLADAAKTLAAGGMSLKQYLPIAERFALVIGGAGNGEALQQVTGALLRAKGGSFGEAMEIFRRAGVGRSEFEQAGGRFSGAGQFMGSPSEFLAALKVISEGQLKRIAEAVEGGDATALSNANDAMAAAFRDVGSILNRELLPGIKRFSEGLSVFSKSGALTKVLESFTGVMGGARSGMTAATDGLVGFGAAIMTATEVAQGMGDMFRWIYSMMPRGQIERRLFENTAGFYAEIFARNRSTLQAMVDFAQERAGNRNGGLPDNGASPAGQTARNTEKLVELTQKQIDLQRIALGGGDLGRLGVTPVELRAMRGGEGGDPIQKAVIGLASAIRTEMMKTVGNSRRLAVG